ncbi:MAG: TolC family protein [Desulfovibrionaceae bacterium]|nr:TolC family protein [Desulfovibrionaceae bacterium]
MIRKVFVHMARSLRIAALGAAVLGAGLAACPEVRAARSSAAASPAVAISMADAVERALRDNPGVGAAAAQSRAAEEGRKSARGAFGPSLGMSYGVSKIRKVSDPYSPARSPEYGTYTWNVDVTQPVFTGFNLLSTYQKAALEADRQKAALRQTRLAMIEEVQSTFLEYLRSVENVRSEGDALARLRDQLKITRAFYNVGLRPRLDVLQAEVDVANAEKLLIQAENTRDTNMARLNTLLGLPVTVAPRYVGELRHVPFSRGLEACLEAAYRNRPDLYMAAKAVAIAEKDRKIVQSDYYPQISAYYNISNYGNTPDMQLAGENGGRGTQWEIGAQATWNVFAWGTTYYADRQAGFNVTRVKYEETNLKLEVGYDIKSRLLAVLEAEKRISVAQKGLEQAQEAYNVAQARYQAQVGTNFDVLDASSKLTAAEASLTGAKADYLTALAQLYVAMGELHPDLMAAR